MEEKKLKVAVNNTETAKEGEQKLSYEKLNEVCEQLYQQNQNLVRQLQQANRTLMFRRLDYLFEVVKAESVFKDPEFINTCINEIKEALIIKETPEEE